MDVRFIVVFDADAVRDLESLKGRQERNAVYAVIDKLRMLGPDLAPPHVKSLKGEAGLLELRPRRGSSPVRPICRRIGKESSPLSRRLGSVHCATGIDVLITRRLSSSR